jgi:hypothetical protein
MVPDTALAMVPVLAMDLLPDLVTVPDTALVPAMDLGMVPVQGMVLPARMEAPHRRGIRLVGAGAVWRKTASSSFQEAAPGFLKIRLNTTRVKAFSRESLPFSYSTAIRMLGSAAFYVVAMPNGSALDASVLRR